MNNNKDNMEEIDMEVIHEALESNMIGLERLMEQMNRSYDVMSDIYLRRKMEQQEITRLTNEAKRLADKIKRDTDNWKTMDELMEEQE